MYTHLIHIYILCSEQHSSKCKLRQTEHKLLRQRPGCGGNWRTKLDMCRPQQQLKKGLHTINLKEFHGYKSKFSVTLLQTKHRDGEKLQFPSLNYSKHTNFCLEKKEPLASEWSIQDQVLILRQKHTYWISKKHLKGRRGPNFISVLFCCNSKLKKAAVITNCPRVKSQNLQCIRQLSKWCFFWANADLCFYIKRLKKPYHPPKKRKLEIYF